MHLRCTVHAATAAAVMPAAPCCMHFNGAALSRKVVHSTATLFRIALGKGFPTMASHVCNRCCVRHANPAYWGPCASTGTCMQMHAHMIMLIPRLQCSDGWLQVACCKPTPTEIGHLRQFQTLLVRLNTLLPFLSPARSADADYAHISASSDGAHVCMLGN